MKLIIVPRGTNDKLQKLFGVSVDTVIRSLKGRIENRVSRELALRIRKAALEMGGMEMQPVETN